jgi:hypothetical protein
VGRCMSLTLLMLACSPVSLLVIAVAPRYTWWTVWGMPVWQIIAPRAV